MGYITIILFFIGFFAFFSKQKKYLTLIAFVVLTSRYFGLVATTFFIGPFSFQPGDLALLLIFSLLPFRKKLNNAELNGIRKGLILFFIFLFVSILYDLFMRGTTPMQIFRTTRKTGYLAFFFLINSFSLKDYLRTIRFLIFITVIQALLYISQYLFGYALTPSAFSVNELGGSRYGNSPTYIIPVLTIAIFYLKTTKLRIALFILFFVTIILTQSRGAILSALSILLIYLFLQNRLKFKSLLIISIFIFGSYNVILNYFPIIGDRFTNLYVQANMVEQMNYNNLKAFYHQGSLIFRLGVTYERLTYVLEKPARIILGLGFIPDMDITSPIFILGTHSPTLPTGFEQYNSVDIFFPNIITRYGIVGSFIFLYFIYTFFSFSFKNRQTLWGKILLTYLSSLLFISLSNETFYNGGYFIVIFLMIGMILSEEHKRCFVERKNINDR